MPQCKEDHKLGFTIKLPVSYSPLAHENTETLLKYSWCNISFSAWVWGYSLICLVSFTAEIQCSSVFNASLFTLPLLKTADQFRQDFMGNITALNYSQSEAITPAYNAYDSVWLTAFALHNASVELANGAVQGRSGLSNFTYADSEINNLILRAARGVNFRGVSVSECAFELRYTIPNLICIFYERI